MSGIAEVLINLGFKITGSDIRKSKITERLKGLGAEISYLHKRENIKGADVLVYSSAIKPTNPEFMEAKRENIPVIPRAEILQELMRMKQGIAIAGTHGKTTTTSIIGRILAKAGLDPTLIVGGVVKSLGTTARLGLGEFLVCEADESDFSFLTLSPVISVITSIDEDHLDNYKNIGEIREAFTQFANRVPFYGCTILCNDDSNIKRIKKNLKKRYITYGIEKGANILGFDIELGMPSKFSVRSNGDFIGKFELSLPGIHYIYNALAAISVGIELEINHSVMQDAISTFEGVSRRFELMYEGKGIKIIDDYAHHPREIEMTLMAARTIHKGRIIAIFQPHLYSRTLYLLSRFSKCFNLADKVIITDIYPAREEKIEGVTGKLIKDAMVKEGHRNVVYIEDKNDIPDFVIKDLRDGDLVMVLGAGDVYKVAKKLKAEMEKTEKNEDS